MYELLHLNKVCAKRFLGGASSPPQLAEFIFEKKKHEKFESDRSWLETRSTMRLEFLVLVALSARVIGENVTESGNYTPVVVWDMLIIRLCCELIVKL